MQAFQKRRIIYLIGFGISAFVIVSLMIDANWVFRVFLALNDKKISLDTNQDGRDDYFEFWENGQLVLAEWDTNYDGRIDYRNRFKDGKLILVELDADYDGYFEYRETRLKDGSYLVEIDENKDGHFVPKMLEKPGS